MLKFGVFLNWIGKLLNDAILAASVRAEVTVHPLVLSILLHYTLVAIVTRCCFTRLDISVGFAQEENILFLAEFELFSVCFYDLSVLKMALVCAHSAASTYASSHYAGSAHGPHLVLLRFEIKGAP